MEDALVHQNMDAQKHGIYFVLILVLMEDALVPERINATNSQEVVLILVLMEDALVHVTANVVEGFSFKS